MLRILLVNPLRGFKSPILHANKKGHPCGQPFSFAVGGGGGSYSRFALALRARERALAVLRKMLRILLVNPLRGFCVPPMKKAVLWTAF